MAKKNKTEYILSEVSYGSAVAFRHPTNDPGDILQWWTVSVSGQSFEIGTTDAKALLPIIKKIASEKED